MIENYQYSEGELFVQEKVDVVRMASRVSRMVQESVDGFARMFVQSQQFCFVSSMDKEGDVWTSMLAGKSASFVTFRSEKKLFFHEGGHYRFQEDILYPNIAQNPSVGMLFIDLTTRQRQRINGRLYQEEEGLRLEVEQSFVNCPKYIQLRRMVKGPMQSDMETVIEQGDGKLPPEARDIIANADTFYVGTAGKNNALDTSHRGGQTGFVQFASDHVLKIPDYIGNNMFVSLGNMHEYPKAGLLFIDDNSHSLLQLQGEAKLVFDDFGHEEEQPTGGTGRYWYFKIQKYILSKNIVPYTWELTEFSPFNP